VWISSSYSPILFSTLFNIAEFLGLSSSAKCLFTFFIRYYPLTQHRGKIQGNGKQLPNASKSDTGCVIISPLSPSQRGSSTTNGKK